MSSPAVRLLGAVLATELATEAAVVTTTVPPLQTIEGVTGVDKGPAYDQAMAELRTFYDEMEQEARDVGPSLEDDCFLFVARHAS